MATTTPNFGWTVPTSTDLVKDGATAIETLGDSIDASFVGLKGGTTGQVLSKTSGTDLAFTWVAQDDSNAIQNAIVDAKGDIIAATANDTPARLAVGANDTVLTADSSTATGLKWAAAASGSMTSLATGTFSNSALSLTSISGSYKALKLVISDAAGNNVDMQFRFNADSGSNYAWVNLQAQDAANNRSTGSTSFQVSYPYLGNTYADNTFVLTLENYANTTSQKPLVCTYAGTGTSNTKALTFSMGNYASVSAITGISTVNSLVSGSYILYGVN
jgi:hypothetical protein